ncbi:MAG: hypothetical protein MUQ27_13495 [Acidimicrobiia bacterium]|nr:hypothetical protein [Acidimicrobiia bacterium]
MTDEKRKPGRPRKWSSDAERMRATRAAKSAKRLADEERREAKRAAQGRAGREQFASPPNAKPVPAAGAPKTGNTWMTVHATCEANIVKLRDELRQLEDEYDDSVYDRWILEHQYRMAITRMQDHDPDGIAWLDEEVRRWESRREGSLEDRRRLRLGGRTARHLRQ